MASSDSSSEARRARSTAALKKLATCSPSEQVAPEELQERAARMAVWPAWDKMRAEDAAEKAKPSLTRPPCQASTRLTREKMRAALEKLVRKPSPALCDCLSPGDYAGAWTKVLEALRWLKGSVRLLMAARWASSSRP